MALIKRNITHKFTQSDLFFSPSSIDGAFISEIARQAKITNQKALSQLPSVPVMFLGGFAPPEHLEGEDWFTPQVQFLYRLAEILQWQTTTLKTRKYVPIVGAVSPNLYPLSQDTLLDIHTLGNNATYKIDEVDFYSLAYVASTEYEIKYSILQLVKLLWENPNLCHTRATAEAIRTSVDQCNYSL